MTMVKPSRRRCAESAVASARSIRSSAARAALLTNSSVKSSASSTSVKSICVSTAAMASSSLERIASHSRRKRPAGDALGLPPLRLRLRLDQIGEPFDFRKIDLAVHEGAPGEFAGLGEPQPGNEHERLHDRRRDRPAARDADFRHLLAGEAARRLKAGDQRPVERLAGLRMAQGSQGCAAVGKLGPRRNRLKRGGTARSGQAHNRDRRPAGAGRRRKDRVIDRWRTSDRARPRYA